MKRYLKQTEAQAQLDHQLGQHPLLQEASHFRKTFPDLDPPIIDPDGHALQPSLLTLRTLNTIRGQRAQRILELGAGFTADALYMAAQGHHVTVHDGPAVCDWVTESARKLGLSDSVDAQVRDARKLTELNTYDVVISSMMLHFFKNWREVSQTIQAIQAATTDGGLNALSVYTTDNPLHEAIVSRGRTHMFKPGELRGYYGTETWQTEHDFEGTAPYFVPRRHFNREVVLIPSIAELIVRKTS